MPEEPGLGEAIRRLDRIEELMRNGLVPMNVYDRDQREIDRRFTALERQNESLRHWAESLAEAKELEALEREVAKKADAEDVQALARRQETAAQQSGTNVRQAIYNGLLPCLFVLINILIMISQTRGGR